MPVPRRSVSVLLLCISLIAASSILLARDKNKDQKYKEGVAQIDQRQRALQALNRLTFGPRPGDIERVQQIGVDKWIEQQLHPEQINDSALQARLAQYRSLRMSTREMAENFPSPPLVKAVMDGKLPMPSDPSRRAIYQAQIEKLREKKDQKQVTAQTDNAADQNAPSSSMRHDVEQTSRREERDFARQRADSLLQMPPDKRFHEIMAMNPDDRQLLAQRLPEPERMKLIADLKPEQRETIMALANPVAVVQSELTSAKLLRAIYSERQLDEVMTDFWFNHFNVFIGKGADRYMITSYERDVIQPHALGKFKDLLMATAKSPAMLFYLDNWMSVGPDSEFARYGPERRAQMYPRRPWRRRNVIFGAPFPPPARRQPPSRQQNAKKKNQSGLNENYARELMELHTLGVNGGYTQKDVTEVARVFTGWTLKEPGRGGDFGFDERKHEPGTKYVLGHKIKQHGEKEGEELLNILAHQPSTARFISTELAQRFVSDDPPQALIDRMAKTFLKKDGDIREVLRTMFRSPEFWSPAIYRARVKTPLEFVASAARATGADVSNPLPLVQTLNRMGMPLYGAQPPTGYKTDSETWVNSSALLNRMNFALALAAGRLPGVTLPAATLPVTDSSNPDALVVNLEQLLLEGDVSSHTHQAILQRVDSPQPKQTSAPLITGLLLGSPEFQRK
jgi:uncharacterized protein (DUF1800 family)